MGVFDSSTYNDARTRAIKASMRLCTVGEIRTVTGKPKDDGSPVRDVTYVPLVLTEPAEDTDGQPLPVGFLKEIGFGFYDQTQGDEKAETTNRITNERIRELVVAALDLPQNHKDPAGELRQQGGPSALKGKTVLVKFSVGKTGQQNVDSFLKPKVADKA